MGTLLSITKNTLNVKVYLLKGILSGNLCIQGLYVGRRQTGCQCQQFGNIFRGNLDFIRVHSYSIKSKKALI